MEKGDDSQSQNQTPNYSKRRKRIKLFNDEDQCSTTASPTVTHNEDHSKPFAIVDVADKLSRGKYGSVTSVIEKLLLRRSQVLGAYLKDKPSDLDVICCSREGSSSKDVPRIEVPVINDLEDDSARNEAPVTAITPLIILDSDEEDNENVKVIVPSEGDNRSDKPTYSFEGIIVLENSVGKPIIEVRDHSEGGSQGTTTPVLEIDTDMDNGLHDCVMEKEENAEIEALDDDQESRNQGVTTPLLESDTDRDSGFHDCVKEEENAETEALDDVQERRNQEVTTLLLESNMDRNNEFHDCVMEEENAEIEARDDGQENRSQCVTALVHQSDTCTDKGKGVCVDVKEDEENVESEAEHDDQETKMQESVISRDKGVYIGVSEENTGSEAEDDALGVLWNQMSFAMELFKDDFEGSSVDEDNRENEEFCDHSFVLKDDLGYVCRVCGIIQKAIETIIDIQFNKVRSMRTYMPTSRNAKARKLSDRVRLELVEEELAVIGISAHPRHLKQMKPHQVEGFKFLCNNLVVENPGGCILAHAPGSGKTFMIISFVQSFLAKYPYGKPLVVLPKGILQTWKKEFLTWQIEDIPLLDLYSAKAESRDQQLEVLKQWVDRKSILFLGYKQFSAIVCDSGRSNAIVDCQNILLNRPSILILDEGHTPRNEDTEVLQSLAKVQTQRKVVLSGTIFQNHVREVFNILNLVRPKFLKSDTSRSIMKRIMSKVQIPSGTKQSRGDLEAAFFESVEHTIQRDQDFRRKVAVIQDLREMTSEVLHYYKGDFLYDLPGLVDFTVVLNLTAKQKNEVSKLKQLAWNFKRNSVGCAVYLHPNLISLSENSSLTNNKMDELLEDIDCRDGVKANFFLNILNLCESAGEKLLVFGQYLQPLKFLERLVMKAKGWSPGREVFVISGDSSAEQREYAMERFNNSSDAKVFFGSIKACGEGISLVGASRVIILDVHLNPSVTRQAIGRAFRPGQKKKVYVYRLVAADSPEEEDHRISFRKETIAKMWFEWNEYCAFRDFEMENVELSECGDLFLESSLVRKDIQALYKR